MPQSYFRKKFPKKINRVFFNKRKALTFGFTSCILVNQKFNGFDEATELFKKALGVDESSLFYCRGTNLVAERIFVLSVNDFKNQIILIIASKNEDIFWGIGKRHSASYPNVNALPRDECFLVNDNMSSPLNKKGIFREINTLLYTQIDGIISEEGEEICYLLDYEKAKRKIIEIQNDIQFDSTDNDLEGI